MRLICPHCMSGVTVPDDTAGKEAACPSCGKSFPTPPRYTAAVSPDATPPPGAMESSRMASYPESPAPPGYIPPSQIPPSIPPAAPPGYIPPPVGPSGFLAPSATGAGSQQSGYTRTASIVISPKVIAWLPAVFLTLTFLLTFFPWIGSYVGGHAIYSQGPWWAVAGSIHRNVELEAVAPGMTVWQEKVKVSSDWLLMVPFLLLLILATAVAIAERVFQMFDPQKYPPVAKLWPKRHLVIAAVSVAALTPLVLQSITGFGLERAIQKYVKEAHEGLNRDRAEAQGNEWKLAMVQYKEDRELARFNLGRTIWMHLAVACTAIAVLAAIGNILLERRGDKPPPKLKMYY